MVYIVVPYMVMVTELRNRAFFHWTSQLQIKNSQLLKQVDPFSEDHLKVWLQQRRRHRQLQERAAQRLPLTAKAATGGTNIPRVSCNASRSSELSTQVDEDSHTSFIGSTPSSIRGLSGISGLSVSSATNSVELESDSQNALSRTDNDLVKHAPRDNASRTDRSKSVNLEQWEIDSADLKLVTRVAVRLLTQRLLIQVFIMSPNYSQKAYFWCYPCFPGWQFWCCVASILRNTKSCCKTNLLANDARVTY